MDMLGQEESDVYTQSDQERYESWKETAEDGVIGCSDGERFLIAF